MKVENGLKMYIFSIAMLVSSLHRGYTSLFPLYNKHVFLGMPGFSEISYKETGVESPTSITGVLFLEEASSLDQPEIVDRSKK